MIIAEISIYTIFSSKQLKMEKHKAKSFSQNFIKSLEFLKRNLESLILLSAYFLCPFNHSFQKSNCNPMLDFLIASSPSTPPTSIKSFHHTLLQVLLSPQGFLMDCKGSMQTFYRCILCYKLIPLAPLSFKLLKD